MMLLSEMTFQRLTNPILHFISTIEKKMIYLLIGQIAESNKYL
jgi:hypothetical protein